MGSSVDQLLQFTDSIDNKGDTKDFSDFESCLSSSDPQLFKQFFDKLEYLQNEWLKSEAKYKSLLDENEKLIALLEAEKYKSTVCENRLKFLQDNHESFQQLRRFYVNMKYNAKMEQMVEVQETSAQTESAPEDDPADVKKCDLDLALRAVNSIKNLVQKREMSCALSQHKSMELSKRVVNLKCENSMLKTYLDAKILELEALKSDELLVDQCISENQLLRKLVRKFDKAIRCAERTFKPMKYPEISEIEKSFIRDMTDPYKIKDSQSLNEESSSSNKLVPKPKKKPPVTDSTIDVLKKLRVFQPPPPLSANSCRTSGSANPTKANKPKKAFKSCDKLNEAFNHVVRSTSATSSRNKRST